MGTVRSPSLFGQTRQAVLSVLLLRPDERFHLRQVVRLAGAGSGAVQRELAMLVAVGLVVREQSGRQVYFQANPRSPIFVELQGLILKTAGVIDVLRDVLHPLHPRIRVALVFGSMARARMHSLSDVDLLVISDDLSMRDLSRPVRDASARLGRDLNVNLYRPDEWTQRLRAAHPLVQSILAHPRLFVFGDEHELERVAEKRLAQNTHAQPHRNRAPRAVCQRLR